MAFIVEDGTGLSTATSYESVAGADAYVSEFMNSNASWAGDATAKQNALIIGTAYLDNRYRLRWEGCRTFREQALAFPRMHICDYDGYAVDANSVPVLVKRATVEAAVRFLTSGVVLEPDDLTADGSVKRLSQRFDVFSRSIEYVGAKGTQPTFSKIDRLLGYLVIQGNTVERG